MTRENMAIPLPRTLRLENTHPKKYLLSVFANQLITESFKLHPFFQTPMIVTSDIRYSRQKILAYVLLNPLIALSGTNINFAKRLRSVPENDLLILQAKEKKHNKSIEPTFTDYVVHPKNDIRISTKDRRKKNKIILQQLSNYSWQLTHLFIDLQEIKKLFLQLSLLFDRYLKLIDDEKLTFNTTQPIAPISSTDLHAHKLYQLTTRHKLSMQQFLHGFFAKPTISCDETVLSIIPYSTDAIFKALNTLYPNAPSKAWIDIAHPLSGFLNEIHEHNNFICHVGNRLFATGLGNLNSLLKNLLQMPLFIYLDQNNIVERPESSLNN